MQNKYEQGEIPEVSFLNVFSLCSLCVDTLQYLCRYSGGKWHTDILSRLSTFDPACVVAILLDSLLFHCKFFVLYIRQHLNICTLTVNFWHNLETVHALT